MSDSYSSLDPRCLRRQADQMLEKLRARNGNKVANLNALDIEGWHDGNLVFIRIGRYPGWSKCNPADTFNLDAGICKALNRAVKRFYDASYC